MTKVIDKGDCTQLLYYKGKSLLYPTAFTSDSGSFGALHINSGVDANVHRTTQHMEKNDAYRLEEF